MDLFERCMYFIKLRCGDVSPCLATLTQTCWLVSLFIVQLRFLSNSCFQNFWHRFTFCAAKSGRPSLIINMLIIQLRGPNTWSVLGIWTGEPWENLHRWSQHIQSIWAEFAIICSSLIALLVQTSKKKCMICMELYKEPCIYHLRLPQPMVPSYATLGADWQEYCQGTREDSGAKSRGVFSKRARNLPGPKTVTW